MTGRRLPWLLLVAVMASLGGCSGSESGPSGTGPGVIDGPNHSRALVPYPPTLLEPQEIPATNQSRPGESLTDLSLYAQLGKVTVIEFFSRRDESDAQMEYLLEQLAALRPGLVVKRFDIDRPGRAEIDYESPLARQFHITKIPSFVIYDAGGHYLTQGDPAKAMIRDWMLETGVVGRD